MTERSGSSSGLLIVFEGIDGSGKSTQVRRLAQTLDRRGVPSCVTKEPGGTSLGVELRSLLLNPEIDLARGAELFLFLADRAQHVKEILKPALSEGKIVLSDRLDDATTAYQGFGSGLPREFLAILNRYSMEELHTDFTVLLDLPISAVEERISLRDEGRTRFETLGRDYFDRVRAGYLEIARVHRDRTLVLDATLPPETLEAGILMALEERFPERLRR
jgi:dTMP kinase